VRPLQALLAQANVRIPDMEIQDSTVGDVAIIQPFGSIDTRGSFDFERKVKERLAGKSRLFAVDFERVELKISGEHGAAPLLGMNPSTLRSRMKVLDIRRPD
jgi:hypothetical protein